jgi:hypothetical protein
MENLPISVDQMINSIDKARTIIKTSGGDGSYLKLSKGGFFVYGVDDTEVEEGSQWAINPSSFMLGYVAWPVKGTGKPLGEEMRSITDDPIAESQLPQVDGSWAQQVGMNLACVSGEDVGMQVVYKASSKGGISGFNDLLNQVMTHLKANPGTEAIVPIIELEVDSYPHPDYGKIYTPQFQIRKWAKITDVVLESEEDNDSPEVEPEPEPEPEAKKEAKKPVRRRRRKAA